MKRASAVSMIIGIYAVLMTINFTGQKIIDYSEEMLQSIHRRSCRSRASEGGKFYWDCRQVRRRECTPRAITRQLRNEITVLRGPRESEHLHPPDHGEAEVKVVLNNLKRMAEEHPEIPPAQVLRTHINDAEPGVLAKLPDRGNLKKNMRRGRRLPVQITCEMNL
ncbi:hypothetical protein QAD02_019208 [Eretmocerus hayati]|uniref:Uncharacterized protein n=1 Tax=Eretmocerus hayati TaxID=131215 RepID=A0ACC2PK54_9HYME|nr:hypothetical protein QAD02_019208 [Eretmocerus hayati]